MYLLRKVLFSFILIITTFNLEPIKTINKSIGFRDLDVNLLEAYHNYEGRLIINKIGLDEVFYNKNNPLNNIDNGLEVLTPSIMPDKGNYIIFIASHSGNSKISYFKNLDKLDLNDDIILSYQDKDYHYKVIEKEIVDKTGLLNIKSFPLNSLVLITCVKDSNKQLIVICK